MDFSTSTALFECKPMTTTRSLSKRPVVIVCKMYCYSGRFARWTDFFKGMSVCFIRRKKKNALLLHRPSERRGRRQTSTASLTIGDHQLVRAPPSSRTVCGPGARAFRRFCSTSKLTRFTKRKIIIYGRRNEKISYTSTVGHTTKYRNNK